MNATLDRPRFEDLVSDLVLVGLVARQRFDPNVGQGESTWCYRVMRRRIVDHYRRQYGDRRSHDPLLDPKSAVLYRPRELRNLLADDGRETDESYAEAVERLGEDLSPEGREALRTIALPLVAGFSLIEIARAMGIRQMDVEARLARLREELEGGWQSDRRPRSPLADASDKSSRAGVAG